MVRSAPTYTTQATASGGTGSCTWAVSAEALPAGLAMLVLARYQWDVLSWLRGSDGARDVDLGGQVVRVVLCIGAHADGCDLAAVGDGSSGVVRSVVHGERAERQASHAI